MTTKKKVSTTKKKGITAKSAKAKGRAFENYIAKEIKAMGFGQAGRTAGSGAGMDKGDIYSIIPYTIECKNQKTISMTKWIDQAKSQAKKGNTDWNKWALIFRDPRTPQKSPDVYVVVDLYKWLESQKKAKEPMIKEPDKEVAWLIKSAINILKKLLKRLEG